jgi:hypothetical protein
MLHAFAALAGLMLGIATGDEPAAAEARRLDFLLGTWKQANRFRGGPFGPEGTEGTGSVLCRWALGGAWLLSEATLETPSLGRYEVLTAVSFDARTGRYRAYSLNSLGIGVEYEGQWQDEDTLVFTALGTSAERRSRVVYTKRRDGSVGFRAEQAAAGGPYEPYFESVLSR